jgi:hypothetical protein
VDVPASVAVTDVLVVGAGAAGIFVADRLEAQQLRCLVVDLMGKRSFATVRNLGWLQSGAYEVGRAADGAAAAISCRTGFDELSRRFPKQLRQAPCHFLFDRTADRDRFVADCQRILGTDAATPRTPADAGLPMSLPARDRPFEAAASCIDVAFDAHAIIAQLTHEIGDRLYGVTDLQELALQQITTGEWLVSCGEVQVIAKAVVFALGASAKFHPELVQRGLAPQNRLFRFVVMNVEGHLCDGIVAAPYVKLGPMLVPHDSHEGPRTVIYTAYNVEVVVDAAMLARTEPREQQRLRERTDEGLRLYLPDIAARLRGRRRRWHVCHRLRTEGAPLVVSGAGANAGLFSVYPAYFTSAPTAADLLVTELGTYLGLAQAPVPLAWSRGLSPLDVQEFRKELEPYDTR